jgi:hypothetical protein
MAAFHTAIAEISASGTATSTAVRISRRDTVRAARRTTDPIIEDDCRGVGSTPGSAAPNPTLPNPGPKATAHHDSQQQADRQPDGELG